jgi:hypothetical protein
MSFYNMDEEIIIKWSICQGQKGAVRRTHLYVNDLIEIKRWLCVIWWQDNNRKLSDH